MKKSKSDSRINREILSDSVRLIDPQGGNAEIVSFETALDRAQQQGLDLVEVNPNAKPPICKIMDYGKYKFQKERQQKEARKKQKIIHVKEVKVRPKIGEHDLAFKLKNAISFLERGDKVKVVVMFRGREIMHYDLGVNLMEKIIDRLSEYGVPEAKMKKEGRDLIAVFASIKKK